MAVTIQALRDAGYPVATLKDVAQIDLAEKDVRLAYFIQNEDFESSESVQLLYSLIFAALLRRRVVATRFGANIKNTQFAAQAEEDAITKEIRGYCSIRVQNYEAANEFYCNDILNIFDKIGLM